MSSPIRVSLSVTSDDQTIVTRAMEAMGRAAAGMALEGVKVYLIAHPSDEDDS